MYTHGHSSTFLFVGAFSSLVKRKKRMVPLVFLSLLLAACQPTPAQETVVNKLDGALETTIRSDPMDEYVMESSGGTGEEPVEPLRTALGMPERASLRLSGPVYGGTLHIEMDAEFHMPEVSRVPVLLVGRLHPSAEDKQRIAETMTGRTVFFGADPLGNERFLNVMEQEKKVLSALEDHPYGPNADYASLQADLTERIQRLLSYYNEMEPGKQEPWTGSWSDELVSIYTESGQHIWIETESKDTCSIQYDASDANADGSEKVIDAAAARRLVEEALGVFGASHYEIVDIRPGDQFYREQFNSETGVDDGSFTIAIRPFYEGIPVYAWNTYYGSDTAAQKAGLSYSRPVVKERIIAGVKNGHLDNLIWIDPLEILSVENENVPLLPLEKIMDIFEKQVFMNIYLDSGERTIRVTDIYFSYRCVKKRDSDLYYLLPVWDFLGYDTIFESLQKRHDIHESILSINAVDGSILNDLLGY